MGGNLKAVGSQKDSEVMEKLSAEGLKLERVSPIRVAYVQLTGPYENWGRGLMELKKWLDSQGVEIVGRPIGLFYDHPTETPVGELKSDACFPIRGEIKPNAEFQVKELPGGDIAITRHVGPADKYTRTYGSFLEDLMSKGFVFYGPAREIFEEPRQDLRPGMGIRIEQLVRKNG